MEEILPGVFHWASFHEGIGEDVHSCYLAVTDPAVLIDPRVPDEGLEWFKGRRAPRHVLLTNRLHYRHSGQFAAMFGATVWCHQAGLHHFAKDRPVRGFSHDDALPGGVQALEVGVLCPEETALYLDHAGGLLALGDAIVRDEQGALAFVPDFLMGDDPAAVKRGLREVFYRHLARDFDHLLLAHGAPTVNGARAELRRFLDGLG